MLVSARSRAEARGVTHSCFVRTRQPVLPFRWRTQCDEVRFGQLSARPVCPLKSSIGCSNSANDAMPRNSTIEQRVRALEVRIDALQRQIGSNEPAGQWWERIRDSSVPDEDWEQLARFGREFRDSDRPPEDDEMERLGDLTEPRHGIVIYWSYERRVFIAEAPQLPDCQIVEGESYQEALEKLLSVMRQWLQAERTQGHEIPWPKRRLMML